ncbi:MAG: hypothetical protein HYV35_06880 [Lentisphaerae bacterium]|nr:hypothetical protein [Lentisphaerota bacterium]
MRILRFCIGLLLIPGSMGLTRTVVASVGASTTLVLAGGSRPFMAMAIGLVAAVIMFWALPRPVRLYVLAHELTHALSGALLGARVSSLRVGAQSGHVKLSQSNWLIALAPYFFPLYTFIVILAYYGGLIFFDLRPYTMAWLGLVGFTLGFHLTFTIQAIAQGQGDIRAYGRFFSLSMVYFVNLLVIGLVLLLVAPLAGHGQALTFPELCQRFLADQAFVWHAAGRTLRAVAGWVGGRIL